MREQKRGKLKSLGSILAKMPEDKAMNILYDMEREFRIDRESLNYLAVSLFRPEEIFEKLALDELALVLRGMSLDSLSTLIDVLDEKNKNICAEILGDRPFKQAVDVDRKPGRRDMLAEMLKVLGSKISKGQVAYRGPALFLMDIPCRPSPESAPENEEVLFQVLNPVVAKDEGVRVLLHVPFQTGGELKLSVQQKGERYFNRQNWLMPVLTDQNGFYYGEIFPDRIPGMNTLWLEIPGAGQTFRNIYFTDSPRSVFSVMTERVELNQKGKCRVSFSLHGLQHADEYVRVKVFCSKCGHPLAAASVKIEKNSGSLEFDISPESRHSGDLFFHVQAGKHQACSVVNTGPCAGNRLRPVTEKDRVPGSDVLIDLPVEPGEVFMYHASSSMQADTDMMQKILAAGMQLHGKAVFNGMRKCTVLELSEADGDLLVMPQADSFLNLSFATLDSGDGFSYLPRDKENYFDLYFTFYKLTEYGVEPFYRYASHVDRKIKIYPVLPSYLEKGESAEVEIMYRSKSDMNVSITNGGSYNTTVKGNGIIRRMFSYGHEYSLSCSGNGETVERLITIPERGEIIGLNRIEYIPPGTVIEPDLNTGYTIYSSPMELRDEIRQRLLYYRWGCAEQTAAKLSAMCWLYFMGEMLMTQFKIILLIKNGIRKMLSYRNADGIYSLFGKNHSMAVTGAILRHLAPLLRFRERLEEDIPELPVIIDDLVRVCGKPGYNSANPAIPFNFGRNLNLPREIDVVDSNRLIESSVKNLRYENGKFYSMVNDNMMSRPAYLSYVAASLIQNGESTLEAIVEKQKTVDILRRNGLAGLLEVLGLLEKKTRITYSDRSAVIENVMEPLLQSIYFTHMTSSSMSTVDMNALIALLSVIEAVSPSYGYTSAGRKNVPAAIGKIDTPVRVESGYTFVKKSYTKQVECKGDGITAELSSSKTIKGNNIRLRLNNRTDAHCVYTVYYPAVLEPAATGEMVIGDQSIQIDSATVERNGGITFTAVRRGRGKIRILYEYMYDTSRSNVIDGGWIEVQ